MRVFFFIAIIAFFSPLHAELPSPSGSPSLEQRIADLEAYVNNSSRGADAVNPATGSNIGGPGPSYNAWMMTCAALVLVMTLPGLALFYGGLVRAKHVLSVLARWLDEWGLESGRENYCNRFRRRHRRSHDVRLVGAGLVHSSWAQARVPKRNHGAAQHGALHGRHRFALGRLVRFQRRKRSRARWNRRERVHEHHACNRGC